MVVLAVSAYAFAKKGGGKPGGGDETPPATGTIYYRADDGIVASAPDGSESISLPLGPTSVPNRHAHGGQRWFLFFDTIGGETDPEGNPRWELFAARADGTGTVQLTDQVELQLSANDTDEPWLDDDVLISFKGVGRDPETATPLTGGVYLAEIEFDDVGNIVGLTAQPNPFNPALELPIDVTSGFVAAKGSYSWAPNLAAITWELDGDLHVTDFLSDPPSDTVIASDEIGTPAWSPDGSRIAFFNGGDIDSIQPDGSDWLIVDRAQKNEILSKPVWSHDGNHLMYGVFESIKKKGPNQLTISNFLIATKAADGSGDRNEIDDAGLLTPQGWRE